MEYNTKKRKFMLAEQEKIGNTLKAKKAKYEADKNDPSINNKYGVKTKASWCTHLCRLDT